MAKLITLPGPPTSLNEGRRCCYIEPASLVEVMFDQLAWLLEHASASCSPECPHCARLEKVKNLLLVPFQAPTEPLAVLEPILPKAGEERAPSVSRTSPTPRTERRGAGEAPP